MRKQTEANALENMPTQAVLAHRVLTDHSRQLDVFNRYEARFDRQLSRAIQRFDEVRARRKKQFSSIQVRIRRQRQTTMVSTSPTSVAVSGRYSSTRASWRALKRLAVAQRCRVILLSCFVCNEK